MHFFCSALIPPPHSAAGSATFWFSRDFYLNRCLEQKATIKKGRRVKVVPDSCLDALRFFFCLKETGNVNYSIIVDNYIHISFFLNIHLFLPAPLPVSALCILDWVHGSSISPLPLRMWGHISPVFRVQPSYVMRLDTGFAEVVYHREPRVPR